MSMHRPPPHTDTSPVPTGWVLAWTLIICAVALWVVWLI